MTGGTFQMTNSSRDGGQILYSGNVLYGEFSNNTVQGGIIGLTYQVNHVPNSGRPCATTNDLLLIDSSCSTSKQNSISTFLRTGGNEFAYFTSPVECSLGDNTATTQQSSSSSSVTAGSSQDGDRDGIPDSSDRCTHNSNPRCFKEGTT